MAIRRKRPHTAAGIALALIGSWLTGSDAWLPHTALRAEEPLLGAALYRPVRPAVVPRNAAEVGYFQPVGSPAKTQTALEKVFEFDVVDVSLFTFLSELEQVAGVRFVFDEAGLEEAAITRDAEITCRSAGMPLGVALDNLLRDLDCAYVAKDGYIVITSRETGDLMTETRLYSLVDHPLLSDAERARLAHVIRQHASPDAGWGDFVEVNVTPGAIAVGAPRDVQERVAAILAQYARLFAEYDSPEFVADRPSNGDNSDRDVAYVPVQKTRTPRDERLYFRPMTRRPRTAAILDRPAEFEIDHKPLGEFFAELSEKLRVPFVLDEQGLADAKMTPQRLLTFRSHGLSYATELSWMLRPYDLTLVPREDEIRVTWLHDLSFSPETRRYAIVDHPLLRGEGTNRLLDAVRRHVAVENAVYPEGWGIRVDDGVLSFSADAEMLDRAEDFLRKYRRLLAQYDRAASLSSQGPIRYSVAWSEAAPTSRYSFRCLAERPWPALMLQRTADIDAVDTPLETVFARAEQALGVPFLLDETGLEEAALTSDAEVTFQSSPRETYAEAFSRMLKELDLAYVPREHYVMITSRESADYQTETRMYAIHGAPAFDRDADGLVSAIQKHLETFRDRWRPATIHVLPGALVVTENARALARVEDFLAKEYGLAPLRYAEKPAPPRGPALTIRPPAPPPPVSTPSADPFGIPAGADPFASGSVRDPFAPTPPDPFGSPAGDPFAPTPGDPE